MHDDDIEPRGTYARALEHMTEVLLTETDTARVLEALARITCETLQADRSLIYEIRLDEQLAVALTEWLNPSVNVTPTKATYPLGVFAAAEVQVRTSGKWLESHTDHPHPAFIVDGADVILHQQMSIQSLLWFPFDFRKDGYYVLAFNQVTHPRKWLPRELEFLRVATRHADLALMQMALKAEQAEAQRALLEAQKNESIAVLAGGVAHDFNNLLGIVLGAVGRTRTALGADSPLASNLRDAERAAREAADLAKHLLAYSGKGQFVVETLDLGALVEEMQDLMRAAVGRVRLHVTSDGSCAVRGDPAQLRQVLMNFVVNAREAIEDAAKGEIAVSVRFDGPGANAKVLLEVRDNGRGIPADVQRRMFEPFFTTKTLGRGLGLAAVSGIVRSHGGDLRVRSAEGEGTTVTVSFPSATANEMAAAPPSSAAMRAAAPYSALSVPSSPSSPSGASGGGATILLVDDSDNFRRMCVCLLGDLGYRTLDASSGAAALDLLERHGEEIDGILLDWTMPAPGGAETFRRVREQRPMLPVVIMSGYAEGDATDLLREGGAAFIEKPFSTETLDAALRTVLQRSNEQNEAGGKSGKSGLKGKSGGESGKSGLNEE